MPNYYYYFKNSALQGWERVDAPCQFVVLHKSTLPLSNMCCGLESPVGIVLHLSMTQSDLG